MPGMPPCWPSNAARASGVRPAPPRAPAEGGPRSGVMGGVRGPDGGLDRIICAASGSSGLYTWLGGTKPYPCTYTGCGWP
jgi:hypothetical protein